MCLWGEKVHGNFAPGEGLVRVCFSKGVMLGWSKTVLQEGPLGGPGEETAPAVLSPGASTGPGRGKASAQVCRLIRGVS